jgi:hypothetical protein
VLAVGAPVVALLDLLLHEPDRAPTIEPLAPSRAGRPPFGIVHCPRTSPAVKC